jgi:anti-anti-sigma regulatory factor
MEIRVSKAQGRVPVTVFHLDGNLAIDSYELLQTQAEQAIQTGTGYLLLDMTDVPYMSSAGIRALNQIYVWLLKLPKDEDAPTQPGSDETSQRLKLLNPCPNVQRTLSLAGLDMFLEAHTDFDQAIASF